MNEFPRAMKNVFDGRTLQVKDSCENRSRYEQPGQTPHIDGSLKKFAPAVNSLAKHSEMRNDELLVCIYQKYEQTKCGKARCSQISVHFISNRNNSLSNKIGLIMF